MEKLSQKALERKSNKPIMEKKRRARINHCLNQLKSLILETDSERSRHSKLEKADILEMTVRYLQTLRAYHIYLQQWHAASAQSPSLTSSPPTCLTSNPCTNININNNNNIISNHLNNINNNNASLTNPLSHLMSSTSPMSTSPPMMTSLPTNLMQHHPYINYQL